MNPGDIAGNAEEEEMWHSLTKLSQVVGQMIGWIEMFSVLCVCT